MIRISRPLPGELTGDINPEDFGFDVIPDDPLTPEEEARIKASLYRDMKERTGTTIPELERYLDEADPGDAESTETEPSENGGEDHHE
ncbi:hypothetical protein ACFWUU_22350 [Kribbella sp. NPDC058693]|uniref:hypothetical protein n=1 Tax=Kribbella sp. NPDC058693 TaxID=3346602 RepID=UPI00366419A4